MSSLTFCYYRFLVSRTTKSYFFLNLAKIYNPNIRPEKTSFFGTPPVNIFIQIVALVQSGRSCFARQAQDLQRRPVNRRLSRGDPWTATMDPTTDWELSKENFQPLRSGRKASALQQRGQKELNDEKQWAILYLYCYIFGFVRNLTS